MSLKLVTNKTHTYKTHTDTLYKRLCQCKRGRKKEKEKGEEDRSMTWDMRSISEFLECSMHIDIQTSTCGKHEEDE